MSILVTGGAGFIGSHVVDSLIKRGENVACVDDFNDYYDPRTKRKNIERALASMMLSLFEGDIRDSEFMRSVFAETKPSVVLHLAARAGVRASIQEPVLYNDVNCQGTLNLLGLSCENGVERFVFGSSSSVYGATTPAPFREDAPCNLPISPYAASKRAAELVCYTYHHLYHIPITCLRFFTVYGPRQRPDMAIHKFARAIESGKPITIFGDGSSMRDYTFIDDVVQGTISALEKDLAFEIINLGNSTPTTLHRLISLIEESIGKKAIIEYAEPQPGDPHMTCADVRRASDLLSFEPKTPIEKGIHEFVRWFRTQ